MIPDDYEVRAAVSEYVPPSCPKCGAPGHLHRFRWFTFDTMFQCWTIRGPEDLPRCSELIDRPGGGHWHIVCGRCGFPWPEASAPPERIAVYQASVRLALAEKDLEVAVRRRARLRHRNIVRP